jgi:hypothetical protein
MLEGLKSKHYAIREAAVVAVGCLAEFEGAQFKMVQEGAIPGSVMHSLSANAFYSAERKFSRSRSLLTRVAPRRSILKFMAEDSRDDSLQQELKALKSLSSLALHEKNPLRIVRDGALEPLYGVVQSPLKTLQHKILAMEIVSNLCRSDSIHRKLVELGDSTGLRRIVAMVGFYDDEVAMHAATAVEHLAANPLLAEKVVEEGALDPLKRILKTNKLGPVLRALNALIALARNSENQASPSSQ